MRTITAEDAKEMTGWAYFRKKTVTAAVEMSESFEVETLEGIIRGEKGDFLCMNPMSGEVWPVKREIFLATYRPVTIKIAVVTGRGS